MPDDQKGLKQRLKRVASSMAAAIKVATQLDFFARFKPSEGTAPEILFPIDMAGDTVWATQAQIAALFERDSDTVGHHISNIYSEGELERPATTARFPVVRQEGERQVSREIEHFSLDLILAVGYRVSGKKATEFRKWANSVLKGYIQDGYALNGRRLDADPAALLRLAQDVRAIRTSEKNLYEQVRETFKACSIDYDKDSEEARRFFAQSQDMFHYAASEGTAAQIILSRADASKPNMGMVALGNRPPTLADAKVAKNYLTEKELASMRILGEQWLLYAESMAIRQKSVSMQRLLDKIQELVSVHEYSIFPGYMSIGARRAQADAHAQRQYEIYKRVALTGSKAA